MFRVQVLCLEPAVSNTDLVYPPGTEILHTELDVSTESVAFQPCRVSIPVQRLGFRVYWFGFSG